MLRSLGHWLLYLFYSRIYVHGRERIPRGRPVLLAANHPNSLIDPAMVGLAAGQKVRFLAKAPLFEIPVLGRLMRALGAVPVFRRSDDPSQVGRNTEMLAEAARALARGEWVGIFPEGKSHDQLALEQVKNGAARIAAQALNAGAGNPVIAPIGINYEAKDRFRSAVWIEVGEPLEVTPFFSTHEAEAVKVRALTAQIEVALRKVVIHLAEPAWEEFLPDLEHLLPAPNAPRSALGRIARRKLLADGMNFFYARERRSAEELAARIGEYRRALAALGLSAHSDLFRLQGLRLWLRQAADLLYLLLAAAPSFIGTVCSAPPYFFTRPLARRCIEPGRTTVALYRLLVGIPVYLVWYGVLWFMLAAYFIPAVAYRVTLAAPFLGLFAYSFWGRLSRFGGLWWQELLVLVRGRDLARLRVQHRQLQQDLSQMAERYRTEVEPTAWRAPPLPSPFSVALRIAAPAALMAAAFLLWERPPAPQRLQDTRFSETSFAQLSAPALAQQLEADEKLLEQLLGQSEEIEQRTYTLLSEFKQGQRTYYRQADDNAIRQLLFSYLTLRSEFLRLAWGCRSFDKIAEAQPRARAFLLGLASASAIYTLSSKFVRLFEPDPLARKKLNEPEPLWQIPADLYDDIRLKVEQAAKAGELRAAHGRYRELKADFARFGLETKPPYGAFHRAVTAGEAALTENTLRGSFKLLSGSVTKELTRSVYGGQAFISTWLGDTRVRRAHGGRPLISAQDLALMRQRLKPGDILIERQNWFLSRAFMPGYWAHAALYVGTPHDLRTLGLAADERVRPHLERFTAAGPAGHVFVIIEAVPRGVRFNTLEDCIGVADSAAVLRPKLAQAQIAEGIARAFGHYGKPYDFNFDFFTTDKLVCTELVYRAYDEFLKFPLVDVLGRKTLPPTELVRSYAGELNSPGAQYELVLFFDGDEAAGKAVVRGEVEFAKTVERPSLTWLQ